MRCIEVLHSYIKKSCLKIHKKRLELLFQAAEGVIKGKAITVTSIGRNIESDTSVKHDIKRIDRLVSSPFLMKDKQHFTRAIIKKLLPDKPSYLPIIVDESVLDSKNERKLIRFSLALNGRPFTLYETVFLNGAFKTQALNFLLSLKNVIPDIHQVIVISDAGFFPAWFKKINTIKNWYWLGRVSLDYRYQSVGKEEWYKTLDLQTQATAKPTSIGEIFFTKEHSLKASLHIYKQPKKGRLKNNKLGKRDMTKTSIEKRKSANEAWIIVTSLPLDEFSAEQIIGFYKFRMQIEEAFRDLKSSRYGFSFNESLTKDIYRLNNLLFIGYLAMLAIWLVGLTGEVKNIQHSYQANTIKTRRVLSLLYLGYEIFKKGFRDIKKKEIQKVFNFLDVYLENCLKKDHCVQI